MRTPIRTLYHQRLAIILGDRSERGPAHALKWYTNIPNKNIDGEFKPLYQVNNPNIWDKKNSPFYFPKKNVFLPTFSTFSISFHISRI